MLLLPMIGFSSSMDEAHDVTMTAQGFWDTYHRNELQADLKYQGTRVSLGGIVREVGKDQDGDPYVIIYPGIHCKFSEEYYMHVSRLQPRTAIGIKGTVVGLRGSFIILKNCQF